MSGYELHNTRGRPRWLDPDVCYELWKDLKKVCHVQAELARRGIVNPTTGKPPSRTGVRCALHLYWLYNLDEFTDYAISEGYVDEDDISALFKYLQSLAKWRLSTTRDRYNQWKTLFDTYAISRLRNIVFSLWDHRCAMDPSRPADHLHHIIPKSVSPELKYEISNVIPLSEYWHNKIHQEGTKKYRDTLQEKVDAILKRL